MMNAAKRQDYDAIGQIASASAPPNPDGNVAATAPPAAPLAMPADGGQQQHLAPHSISSEAEIISIDAAIDNLGTGRFQIRVLIVAGLCFAADSMEIMLLSFLSIILQDKWGLTSAQTATITSCARGSTSMPGTSASSRHTLRPEPEQREPGSSSCRYGRAPRRLREHGGGDASRARGVNRAAHGVRHGKAGDGSVLRETVNEGSVRLWLHSGHRARSERFGVPSTPACLRRCATETPRRGCHRASPSVRRP